MQENKNSSKPHSLTVSDRKKIIAIGVLEMGTFDDNSVTVYTSVGELSIKGRGLHIDSLNLEKGELSVQGDIVSLSYSNNHSTSGGFFSRIFK